MPGQSQILTSAGCVVDEKPEQKRDCSKVCTDPTQIFNDTSTLANCMALPLITQMLSSNDVTDSMKEVASSFGISNDTVLSHKVNSTLSDCFYTFCQQSPACKEVNEAMYGNSLGHGAAYYYQSMIICDAVEQKVLGDIAG